MNLFRSVLLACLATACALPPERNPRAVVVLSPRPESSEIAAGAEADLVVEPDSRLDESAPASARSRRFEIESAALTRAFGRPMTVGAEVVLPQRFSRADDFTIVYHVPDLGEDPARVAESLAALLPESGLVLVVLDPRGIFGHHLFVDSVNEGPQGEALVTDMLPVLEQHLAVSASARRRILTGNGLGGWSAIRLQIEYCHAFDAAYAFDPDPVDLRCFYGADLTRALWDAPSPRTARGLREDRLSRRIASFESAIGPRGADGQPMALFAGPGEQLRTEVVAAFARRDPAAHVRLRGKTLAARLDGKIHAIARGGDALSRDVALRMFEAELAEQGIQSVIRTPERFDLEESIVGAWGSMAAGLAP